MFKGCNGARPLPSIFPENRDGYALGYADGYAKTGKIQAMKRGIIPKNETQKSVFQGLDGDNAVYLVG